MNSFRLARPGLVLSSVALLLGYLSVARAETTPPTAPPAVPSPTVTAPPGAENSVVKVFSTVRYPEVFRPWSKQPPQEITGSGVIIDGKRILTNAHVVLYASEVQIQANQSGDKVSAKVVAVAPGIDLALLKLDDESFFDEHSPIPRGSTLPEVKDGVLVYGFPTGGTSLSITKGIVSRIEFTQYNFPVSGLRIQVDAAINPGNSGGPAIADEKMIGLAFSVLGGAQNIGYIIPNEEIELFLADVADGKYDGKPIFNDEWQKLQNQNLKAFLKLDRKVEGVVVRQTFSDKPDYPLRARDVITKIGNVAVDAEGMVKIAPNLRVRFDYEVQKAVRSGKVPLTVIRDQKELQVDVPVSPDRPVLIPDLGGAFPSYFVYGPMVFSTVTSQFVGSINRESIDGIMQVGTPLITRRGDKPDFPDERLVAVSAPFFPHKLAQGYWPPVGWVVKSVNQIQIRNLPHLIEVLRDARSEFVVFEFYGRGVELFAFPRTEMLAATDDILSDNGLRSQGSPDALAVWNQKATP